MTALDNTELLSLIDVMRAMNEAADTENWKELSRLDNERRSLLQTDPASDNTTFQDIRIPAASAQVAGVPVDDPKRMAMIREIQTLDQQILASAQAARQKLLDEHHELSAQVKAKNLYAQTSSIG